MLRNLIFALALLLAPAALAGVTTKEIASGFDRPVWAEPAPGSDDLWVVEKPGKIVILNRETGEKSDFLDIRDLIKISMNEQGLLGLAFAKDYAKTGRFYVYYTNLKGATEVCRFVASGPDKRTCDPSTRELLLTFPQFAKNHNGGWIGFGPDGHLYIGTGDGGSANDPKNYGQDLSVLLGKILRIDVSDRTGYSIPSDNPFKSRLKAKPEIYAYGLRNPWRCSWDRETGDFYIADVGQNHWEEIHFAEKGNGKGANYGWRLREGLIETPKKGVGGDKPSKAIDPVYVYKHGTGEMEGLSVTGGYVYRGPIQSLRGKYFFGDYVNPRIWSFEMKGGQASNVEDWTGKFGKIPVIASFGEDHEGNLLIISHTGTIHQVIEE